MPGNIRRTAIDVGSAANYSAAIAITARSLFHRGSAMSGNRDFLKISEQCRIDPADPWRGDFGRQQFASNLTDLLTHANTPLVLSIEGGWGTGKTTFIERWTATLRAASAPAVILNAWTTSTYDVPRIALFGELSTLLRAAMAGLTPDDRRLGQLEGLMGAARDAFKAVIASSAKTASLGIINDDVRDALRDGASAVQGRPRLSPHEIDEAIDGYEKHKACYADFRRTLGEVADALRGSSPIPLVLVVDELDRCRPDFALEMLECMRHLFSAANVAFVVAIDADQIDRSLRHIYGSELDTNRYLQRIFNVRLSLPKPKYRDVVVACVTESGLHEVIGARGDSTMTSDLIEYVTRLIMAFDLDIRATERLISEVRTCTMIAGRSIQLTNLVSLITLRLKNRAAYQRVEEGSGFSEVLAVLERAPHHDLIRELDPYRYFLANIYAHLLAPAELDAKLAELRSPDVHVLPPNAAAIRTAEFVQLLERLQGNRLRGAVGPLLPYIDLINMHVPIPSP